MNAKGSLRKRFLSLALAVVMMLGMVPTSTISAFAISSDPLGEAKTPMDEVIEKNGGEKTFTVNLDKTIVDGGLIIYSEKTLPRSLGGEHDRGLGMYMGQVDPNKAQNEGVGGYAFCGDHQKDATSSDAGMSVTVNDLNRVRDPFSIAIYYNGYTSTQKDANYVRNTLFPLMDRIWDYEYAKTNDWLWQKPEWFSSGWQESLLDSDWRRATQIALWMSQRVTVDGQETNMLYLEGQLRVNPDTGSIEGCWDNDAPPPFDSVWFSTENASAQLNTGLERRRIFYAALALYWYASYQVYRGVDYTQRTPTSHYKLVDEDQQLTKANFVTTTATETTIDFSSAAPNGSGTSVSIHRAQ